MVTILAFTFGAAALAFMFGAAALVLFIAAFNHVMKGRIGSAVVFGLVAVVCSGIAGGLATALD